MAKLSRESSSIDDIDEEHAKLRFSFPTETTEKEKEKEAENEVAIIRDPSMEERRGPNDEL